MVGGRVTTRSKVASNSAYIVNQDVTVCCAPFVIRLFARNCVPLEVAKARGGALSHPSGVLKASASECATTGSTSVMSEFSIRE